MKMFEKMLTKVLGLLIQTDKLKEILKLYTVQFMVYLHEWFSEVLWGRLHEYFFYWSIAMVQM